MTIKILGIVVLLALVSCGSGDQSISESNKSVSNYSMNVVKISHNGERKSVQFGSGVNSLELNRIDDVAYLNECIEYDKAGTIYNTTGSEVRFSLSLIESKKEYYRKTGVEGSLGAKFKILLDGSLNGSRKGEGNYRYDSSYLYGIVEAQKIYVNPGIKNYRMKKNLPSTDSEEFFKKCGDQFVSDITLASKAIGIIRCSSNSVDQKRKIVETIEANSGSVFDVSLTHSLEKINKSASKKCTLFVDSVGGSGTFSGDFKKFQGEVVKYILNSKITDAVAINVNTKSYHRAFDTDDYDEILDDIDQITEMANYKVAGEFGMVKAFLKELERNVLLIDLYDFSGQTVPQELLSKRDSNVDRVVNHKKIMTECMKDPFKCTEGIF